MQFSRLSTLVNGFIRWKWLLSYMSESKKPTNYERSVLRMGIKDCIDLTDRT